jgi:hypothetical protein
MNNSGNYISLCYTNTVAWERWARGTPLRKHFGPRIGLVTDEARILRRDLL